MEQSNWSGEFLRESFLGKPGNVPIYTWSERLLHYLAESKPDQEVHLLGVSRIPKTPNFLLGSTNEIFPEQRPLPIRVTEQTAELFLSPTEPGIRILREDLPMSVVVEFPGESPRKRELNFYEAICLDGEECSLVMALVLQDMAPEDFMPPEELAELYPQVMAQGIPYCELYMLQETRKLLEEEANLMAGLLRSSNPELAGVLSASQQASAEGRMLRPGEVAIDPGFLVYTVQEFRQSLNDLMGNAPTLNVDPGIKMATERIEALLRNFSNAASLLQPGVALQIGDVAPGDLLKDVGTIAGQLAARHRVDLRVEEQPDLPMVRSDRRTLSGLLERLLVHTVPLCRDGSCYIRLLTSRNDPGFVWMELEDSLALASGTSPDKWMEQLSAEAADNPRLKRGAGLLYKLLSIFQRRCGGDFRLVVGRKGGLTARFVLPISPVRRQSTPPPKEAAPADSDQTPRSALRLIQRLDVEIETRKTE